MDGFIHRSKSMLTLVFPWLRPLTHIEEISMLGKAKKFTKNWTVIQFDVLIKQIREILSHK